MRLKLFLLLLSATISMAAHNAGFAGKVVDAETGSPIADASVMLRDHGVYTTTNSYGEFSMGYHTGETGKDVLVIIAYGYRDAAVDVDLNGSFLEDLGQIKMTSSDLDSELFYGDQADLLIDQSQLEDEDEGTQAIGALLNSSDNVFYSTASYDFSPMYFRARGYNSEYQKTYINGIGFNDLARGRFSYSTLGGMTSRAFRNRTNVIGLGAANYGFGDIGGSTNFSTYAADYAPGFNGSVAYTNSNYMLRAMATYSTGVNKHGWAMTVSAIGRYADEGVAPGTFYNSAGYFLAIQKVINPQHSISLTTFGAPTQRATTSPVTEEAVELADDYLYNPNWGWLDGEKRNARIVETFDPTTIINWIWKPQTGTTLNTGAAVRWINYSKSSLEWGGNSADPRPDYYRNLPSYYKDDQETFDLYTDLWRNNESMRQINWERIYQANELNNYENQNLSSENKMGSSYILEDRHSNQFNVMLNSTLNHRINDNMSLQGGVSFNYTKASYYKTVRDLLGGEFWLDVDKYSERDFPDQPAMLQNDLNNPNRRVVKGDRFGYDYDINAIQATAWLQNTINTSHWDVNYGLNVSYTQFARDGKMRNGRAPLNSYGKGETHRFDNAGLKAGATYKLDGRNYFTVNALYETRAPLFEYAYISPRIKDVTITGLSNERILSGDIGYTWNYRRFRGSITGFWTEMYDQTERTSFYDEQFGTFLNYAITGIHKSHKGVEVGVAYKITPSLTASFAGTYSRYQYKNNPTATRSYENGIAPDSVSTLYYKNVFVSGTPQTAFNVGLDWAAPGMWFFNINASWMGDAYVSAAPARHEELYNLWQKFDNEQDLKAKVEEIAEQQKLNDAFVLNASVGKVVYINRKVSLNVNVSVNNVLNNRKIQTYGYQQHRLDSQNYDISKYPNKYSYAQGIKAFVNVGVKF